MIPNNYKTSLLIPSQLPQFIRDDPSYANFVSFLKAYYEWLELSDASNSATSIASTTNQGTTYAVKNLLNYDDIDATSSEFINYFCNDFMQYFPPETSWAATNKAEVIKIARQLYQSKGTPASFQFLFRVLYNTDVDFFFTKDAVLRASAGKWYVPKSVRLDTVDTNFLNINNLRLFGQTTKSIATIENSILAGDKTEVFISNIERLFQSGELVNVVDSKNQIVYFLNNQQVPANTPGAEALTAKIVGQISQITISKDSQGNLLGGSNYKSGDPVVVYGGVNPNTPNPIIAIAEVGTTTLGTIQRCNTVTGGYGYTDAQQNTSNSEFTLISFSDTGTTAQGAPIAHVGSLDPTTSKSALATNVPIEFIGLRWNTHIGNTSNPIQYGFGNGTTQQHGFNDTLSNTLTFTSFTTHPISSVVVDLQGSGITQAPVVTATSQYETIFNIDQYTNNRESFLADLKNLGILAPIQITNGGVGYQVNDIINFNGGTGYGAIANVTSVNSTGAIITVSYQYTANSINNYPLGGMGYSSSYLPTLTVTSANSQASNASLYVPCVLGDGATFSAQPNGIGTINSIIVSNPGEDYIGQPNISLRVQDIVVSNVNSLLQPQSGQLVYQGANSNTATYFATVYSINAVDNNPSTNTYIMRVYNYNQFNINPAEPLVIDSIGAQLYVVTNSTFSQYYPFVINGDSRYNATSNPGIMTYGDGSAKATTAFLNGLIIGQGQYLDTSGQPSGFDVLQSADYNNYTYEITLEKEIAKYRSILLNLLHPTGMKVLGRFAMKSNSSYDYVAVDVLNTGTTLYHYTQTATSNAVMVGSFTNPSNNKIQITGLAGANLANIILQNTTISFTTTAGDMVQSKVISVVGGSSNTVTIADNVWLSFANVAYINAMNGTNIINITGLTNSYDIVNNGMYSNTAAPLRDIVRIGDTVSIQNNSIKTVTNVDYTNNILYLSSNLANTVSNGLLSVTRTMVATANSVLIFGPIGVQYYPELTDEQGNTLLTEDGNLIILG